MYYVCSGRPSKEGCHGRRADILTVRLLREIRAGLDDVSARQDLQQARFDDFRQETRQFQQRADARFDEMSERFDELRDVGTHTFGVAATNDVKLREHGARLRGNDSWRKQTEESIAALERRVGRLEAGLTRPGPLVPHATALFVAR